MTRVSNKLNARKVETLKTAGRYSDGNGLYLRITPDGGRRWTFVFTWPGRRHPVEIGLGAVKDVSLASAREKARACRDLVASGINPIDARRVEQRQAEEVKMTFGSMADKFIEGKEGGWKNEKHRDQWRMTLSRRRDGNGELTNDGYCRALATIPIADVSTEDILGVLNPVWLVKPETARRVRGRIEAVIDAAKALGYRSGENPARLRGHLATLLPKSSKLSRGHHAAMPYGDVPRFFQKLLDTPSVSNLALAFVILTAARSGEVMGAVAAEFDLKARLWQIPAERMKAGRPHSVPLSDQALEVLEQVAKFGRNGNPNMFPGQGSGQLSVMALAMALRRAGGGAFTVHGMRSAFRDWCGDRTTFAREDVELCLAHTIRDETERAYRRSDALDKRRDIMTTWGAFLTADATAGVIHWNFR